MATETEVKGSWKTGSGLLDDFEFEVTEAWFATDAQYQNGQIVLLHLKGTTDSDDTPEVTETFPCGKGWESLDGGKTVQFEGGKSRGFNNMTAYGKFIDNAIEVAGAADVLQSRGEATEAKVWTGLRFHMKRETEEFKIKGEPVTRSILKPVAFLGEAGGKKGGKKAAAPTNGATAEDAPTATTEIDKVILAKLRIAAKKADTQEEFVDAAMELEAVTSDDAVLSKVLEPEFYAELRA